MWTRSDVGRSYPRLRSVSGGLAVKNTCLLHPALQFLLWVSRLSPGDPRALSRAFRPALSLLLALDLGK